MQFGVSESIAHWGKYRPNVPALYSNGVMVSFSELNASVDTLCIHFQSVHDLPERIGIAVSTKFDFLISLIAILRHGRSVVIVNTGLPVKAIRTTISEAQIKAIIYDRKYDRIAEMVRGPVEHHIDVRSALDSSASQVTLAPHALRKHADEWGVLFSSGTTGVPKGISRDHDSIITELLGWCLELPLSRRDCFYIGRPVFYTGGLVLSLATLLVGGSVVLNDFENDDSPQEVWQDYQRTLTAQKISWAFFVPDQLRAFMRFVKTDGKQPLAAATVLVMGAAIGGQEKVAAHEVLKSEIVESWGNSESLGTITDPEDLYVRPCSVGRPFLTDEMCIVDEGCNPVSPGEQGRIAGGQEGGFQGYCSQPEATARVRQKDLIVSEDIGYIGEDGYIFVCGRVQDCVRVHGETIFLSAIESRIRMKFQELDVCIVANEPKGKDTEIIGVIQRQSQQSSDYDDLLRLFNDGAPPSERLDRLVDIDCLPRVPSGKIDRVAIQKLVERS